MFGWFKTKSPLKRAQRQWIDERFAWLRNQFDESRLFGPVITPTDEFFPDRYAGTPDDTLVLFDRMCQYMGVDRKLVDLDFYIHSAADDVVVSFNPALPRQFPLGQFTHEGDRAYIQLEQTRLREPHSVVATLAHELAHYHLLVGGRCSADETDNERLTDLATVYFGFGVFAINNTVREANWTAGNFSGWTMSRQGYLSMAEFAYALAIYSVARRETKPAWVRHLRSDARALFAAELKQLVDLDRPATTLASWSKPIDSDNDGGDFDGSKTEEVDETADVCREQAYGDESPAVAGEDDSENIGFETVADALFTHATTLLAQGHYESAIEGFTEFLEKNPEDAEAWEQRGRAQLALRRYAKAATDFSQALRYEPDAAVALRCRAAARLGLRLYEKALADAEQALDYDGADAEAHFLRGLAFIGLKEYAKAVRSFKSAINKSPNWGDAYLARSQAYAALGKLARAQADRERALNYDPSLQDAQQRINRLYGLRLTD